MKIYIDIHSLENTLLQSLPEHIIFSITLFIVINNNYIFIIQYLK